MTNNSYIQLYNDLQGDFATENIVNNIEPAQVLYNNIQYNYLQYLPKEFDNNIKSKILTYTISNYSNFTNDLVYTRDVIIYNSNFSNCKYRNYYTQQYYIREYLANTSNIII